MKRVWIVNIVSALLLLLFLYTATSKFLDYDRFVFQMKLAPVPLMQIAGPILAWLVPSIEILLVIGLTVGFFKPKLQVRSLAAGVILLIVFELYISIMLLSGSHLPCTCGGIISEMDWKAHLLFNGVFIIAGLFSIKISENNKSPSIENDGEQFKILSRA